MPNLIPSYESKLVRAAALACTLAIGLLQPTDALAILGPTQLAASTNSQVSLVQTASTDYGLSQTQTIDTATAQAAADQDTFNSDPCHKSISGILTRDSLTTDPSGTLVTFIESYCLDAANYLPSINVPYFCFYTGSILISKIKQNARLGVVNDNTQIQEYCDSMSKKQFTPRTALFTQIIAGKPCFDEYESTYTQTTAAIYDPISTVVSPRMMCQEFVQEVNALLELNDATVNNAVRFSYLVSMITDIEASQVETFEDCAEYQAKEYPKDTCVRMITSPGIFDLYSDTMKAEVCQIAINELSEIYTTNQAVGATTNHCAVLTSQIFQSYSWFLQDLDDTVVGALVQQLSTQLTGQTNYATATHDQAQVSNFLKQSNDSAYILEGQNLYNSIVAQNAQNQALQQQTNLNAISGTVAANNNQLQTIQSVSNELSGLADVAAQPATTTASFAQVGISDTQAAQQLQDLAYAQQQEFYNNAAGQLATSSFLNNIAQGQQNNVISMAQTNELTQTASQPNLNSIMNLMEGGQASTGMATTAYPQQQMYSQTGTQVNYLPETTASQSYYQQSQPSYEQQQYQYIPQQTVLPQTSTYYPQQSTQYNQLGQIQAQTINQLPAQQQMLGQVYSNVQPQQQMLAQTSQQTQPNYLSLPQTSVQQYNPYQLSQTGTQSYLADWVPRFGLGNLIGGY